MRRVFHPAYAPHVASTGPRSIERGDLCILRDRAIAKVKLQRGRVQLNAEIQESVEVEGFGGVASTGPRSIERGDDHEEAGIVNPIPASTGPRSIERGDKGSYEGEGQSTHGFNGAAFN